MGGKLFTVVAERIECTISVLQTAEKWNVRRNISMRWHLFFTVSRKYTYNSRYLHLLAVSLQLE